MTTAPSGLEGPVPASEEAVLRPRRLAWAELLRRVFAVDVLECPHCGGRMRLLAAIQPPEATATAARGARIRIQATAIFRASFTLRMARKRMIMPWFMSTKAPVLARPSWP